MVIDSINSKGNYFSLGPEEEADMRASAEITQQWNRNFKDVFTSNGCFSGTFSLWTKPNSKLYQLPHGM